jgi:hypothetical protein
MFEFIDRFIETQAEEKLCHQYIDIIHKYSNIKPIPYINKEEMEMKMYIIFATGIAITTTFFGTMYLSRVLYRRFKLRNKKLADTEGESDDEEDSAEDDSDEEDSVEVNKITDIDDVLGGIIEGDSGSSSSDESGEIRSESYSDSEKFAKDILESMYNDIDNVEIQNNYYDPTKSSLKIRKLFS